MNHCKNCGNDSSPDFGDCPICQANEEIERLLLGPIAKTGKPAMTQKEFVDSLNNPYSKDSIIRWANDKEDGIQDPRFGATGGNIISGDDFDFSPKKKSLLKNPLVESIVLVLVFMPIWAFIFWVLERLGYG